MACLCTPVVLDRAPIVDIALATDNTAATDDAGVGGVAEGRLLESVRQHYWGLQSFRSMRRMDARRRKASALRFRFSQSLANRRQRLSQPMVAELAASEGMDQALGTRRPPIERPVADTGSSEAGRVEITLSDGICVRVIGDVSETALRRAIAALRS